MKKSCKKIESTVNCKATASLQAEIVDEFMIRENSILSRFALYADHAHLSPLGNRLMAESVFKTIEYKWN